MRHEPADPNTVRAEVRRADGSLAGEGSYIVVEDGTTMTATTVGFDSQLRRFEMRILDYFAKNGYVIVGKHLPADEHNLYFTPLNR